MTSSREKLIGDFAPGTQYLRGILHDARTWLDMREPILPKERAIEFLARLICHELKDNNHESFEFGNEYLKCILQDSRAWLDVLGPSIPRDKAIQFLANRVYLELEKNNDETDRRL